jgi:hypothetical protein
MRRVIFEVGPRHDKELDWLMERWGLDRSNTLRMLISNEYREAKLKDQRSRETKKED